MPKFLIVYSSGFSMSSKKRFPVRELTGIFLFVLFLAVTVFAVKPLFQSARRYLNDFAVEKIGIIENEFGVKFTYKSLSPSVFTGINIRGITVSDIETGDELLEIRKTVFKYNFFHLITGNFSKAFRELSVDGLTVSLTDESISGFADKLKENRSAQKNEKLQKKEDESVLQNKKRNTDRLEKLESFFQGVPFEIFIKNVHFQYSSQLKIADVFMRRLDLNFRPDAGQLSLKTGGSILYNDDEKKRNCSAQFSMNGNIFRDFNGSLLNFQVSDVTDGNFKFNRLNMQFGYEDSSLSFRTIQNAYPFYISGKYDFSSKNGKLDFQSQQLNPGKLFYVRENTKLTESLSNLLIDMNAEFNVNSADKTFSYISSGKISAGEKLFTCGETASFSLKGSEKQLDIEKLSFEGQKLNGNVNLSMIFDGFKLSGSADLYNYTLSNGGNISTEIYFDKKENGFMAFAPELLLDDKSFTGLEINVIPSKDSVDFNFEVSDYAHPDSDIPGTVKGEGSFDVKEKFFQTNVISSGLYLDSIAESADFFRKNKSGSDFAWLSPYMSNFEVYVSSNLSSYSMNLPYLIVANTKKDNQFVYISLDSSDTSLSLTRFDIISNGEMISSTGSFEKEPGSSDAFFVFDSSIESIPYHFTGNIIDNHVSLNGDYGFSVDFTAENSGINGTVFLDSFPVEKGSKLFTVSVDSDFSFDRTHGFEMHFSKLVMDENGGTFSINPHLDLSGNITSYGAIFDKVLYSDKFSALTGKTELFWNINDGIFDSVNLNVNLKDSTDTENIDIHADFSNPERKELSKKFLQEGLYLNSSINLKDFNLNRFSTEQSPDNKLNATLSASGTLENPFLGMNISEMNLILGKKHINTRGSLVIEGNELTVSDFNVTYNNSVLSGIKANLNLNTFSGSASCSLDSIVSKKTVHAPLFLTVSDSYIEEGKILPSEFAINLSCENVSGSFIRKEFPFDITLLKAGGTTSIFTSDNIGLSGSVSSLGRIDFRMQSGKPVDFSLSGAAKKALNIDISGIRMDLGQLASYVNIDSFGIYGGVASGNVNIRGTASDPDFTGKLELTLFDFTYPQVIPSRTVIAHAQADLNHNVIEIGDTRALIKNIYPLHGSASVYFDRWYFDHIDAKLRTPKNVYAPVDLNLRLVEIAGDANVDLNLVFQDSYLDITGKIAARNALARAKTREIASGNPPPKRSWWCRSDLDINLGQHCSFRFDPLLRAVFAPDSKFNFKYDMETSDLAIDGDIVLRSGDIAYLSRSFYLKNGIMKFNRNETTFDPIITLTAETRERDEDGNDVRIILSAQNQYLTNFEPQFSSIPAKSEIEIRNMLGQIAVGDSESVSGFLFSAGEYALQSTFGRTIENKLRDFFNFDILSIRTSVLQNALKQSIQSQNSDSEKNKTGIGNYLDNSTVYIGKYLGSSLYADALMHWSYDETRVSDNSTADGLIFQPEIGLEMESPFANIRWSMSPDIDALSNSRFVSSTSVTLSWKFSF